MASRMSIQFRYLIFVAALVQFAIGKSSGTTHTVGEDMGWTIPSSSDAYSTWASSKTFVVGDTLLFNFPGVHTVAEVSKTAYDACNTKSIPIGGSILSTSPSTIRLNTAGAHFYICTVGEHCMFGQKLFVNVNGTNRTTTSTPPPTTSAPLPTIATPPPSTVATPPSSMGSPLSSKTTPPTNPPSIETPNTISVAPTEGPSITGARENSGSSSSSSSSSLAVAKISLTLLFSGAALVFFL